MMRLRSFAIVLTMPVAMIVWASCEDAAAQNPRPDPIAVARYEEPIALGPTRAYRRMAGLPCAAIAFAPRAVYAGTLAPWGSIPPGFYAASAPIFYVVARPPVYDWGAQGEGPEGHLPAGRSGIEPFTPPSPSVPPRAEPAAPAIVEPALPETIPTPPPMDVGPVPSAARKGGLINPGVLAPRRELPFPKSATPQQPIDGPREF